MKRSRRRRGGPERLIWTFLLALAVLLGCFCTYFWLLGPDTGREVSPQDAGGPRSHLELLEGDGAGGTEPGAR